MSSTTQTHSPHFRQEIAEPFFQLIQTGESCVVAGVAGLGKSRLLQFLQQEETCTHYLGDSAQSTFLVWVDCNRMADLSPWGLYELLFTALLEKASDVEEIRPLCEQLLPLRSESIIQRNSLLAQRNLELALHMLCKKHNVKFALILDEFDECYRTLEPQVLANLLALRDANKYQLCYALFMRDHPAALRNPDDCEGFYELLSRSVLYLTPYHERDAREAVGFIADRRSLPLDSRGIDEILRLSGGHPGLIVGLFAAIFHHASHNAPPPDSDWFDWANQSPEVQEECRKIWDGLGPEEQRVLHHVALGTSVSLKDVAPMIQKGMLRTESNDSYTFFTPLFRQYTLTCAKIDGPALAVDKASGIIWVSGKASEELTGKEYDLAIYLGSHINQLCSNEEIISHVWPGDEGYDISSNAVAALVRRLRKKIEPTPSRPQYLISVKGRGYRLMNRPELK